MRHNVAPARTLPSVCSELNGPVQEKPVSGVVMTICTVVIHRSGRFRDVATIDLSLDERANRIQQITEQNSEDAHQRQGMSRTSTELAQRLYHISQG